MESGWNVYIGVASGCGEQEVGVGGIYGCGCKEVYRFPHTTYPYSSCISSFFAAASLLFVHLKKFFSFFIYLYPWVVHLVPQRPPVNTQRTNLRLVE